MIWILPIAAPLLVALLLAAPGLGNSLKKALVVLSPLPALALALFAPADGGASFPSVVLGLELGFGEAGQIYLLFTSVLWLAAAIYGQGYLSGDARQFRFHGFFLLTLTGNIGLILARDVPAFYTFFAMMTFSGFGLVIHTGTPEAKRAARLYLITAIAGEALLLGAIFLAVGAAGSVRLDDIGPAVAESDWRNLIMLLAFFGFGVKAGALPVHFWLPLAHPVAPVPASAVLSGSMIKAGLLGWLYFLPMGQVAFSSWGLFCIVAGIAAALGAVLVGMTQRDPKTMLAYSSISQMGVMTLVLGIGLASPSGRIAVLPVILLYALNHALAKGALFFGAGVAQSTGREGRGRWWVAAGLAIPALAVAGAPWTGGSVAKHAVKDLAAGMPEQIAVSLAWLLPLSSVATSLLLGRFLWVVWKDMGAKPGGRAHPLMWASWGALIAGVIAAVAFAMGHYAVEIATSPATAARVWKEAWPIALALGLLLASGRFFARGDPRPAIPAGDLVVLLERGASFLRLAWNRLSLPGPSRWGIDLTEPLERLAGSGRRNDLTNWIEERMRHRSVPGVFFMLLALALTALVLFGTRMR